MHGWMFSTPMLSSFNHLLGCGFAGNVHWPGADMICGGILRRWHDMCYGRVSEREEERGERREKGEAASQSTERRF